LIDKDGTPKEVSVSKSTGFATLDQGCVKAIQQAPFIPAHKDGEAIEANATIKVTWRRAQ
jgi:TonB family protein